MNPTDTPTAAPRDEGTDKPAQDPSKPNDAKEAPEAIPGDEEAEEDTSKQ